MNIATQLTAAAKASAKIRTTKEAEAIARMSKQQRAAYEARQAVLKCVTTDKKTAEAIAEETGQKINRVQKSLTSFYEDGKIERERAGKSQTAPYLYWIEEEEGAHV